MYKKLHDIAIVIAGYTFRGAVKSDNNGDISVFQAKDLVQGRPFEDARILTKISHLIPAYTGHLKKNDILLVARGMKSGTFRSTIFVSEAPNVIASSSVHVIRITAADILPEYISHYLNSKDGQEALTQIVSGSYIGVLPRKELEKIKIPTPSLEKQNAIIHLHSNILEQQKIIERQNQIKQNIIDATFRNLMEG
ncbi:MAG: restriction endonuclease subunit S [Pseudomonadota bacterium]